MTMSQDHETTAWSNVVKFILDRGFKLTAFELMHELIENGQDSDATELQNYFSDIEKFPPEDLLKFNTLSGILPLKICRETS